MKQIIYIFGIVTLLFAGCGSHNDTVDTAKTDAQRTDAPKTDAVSADKTADLATQAQTITDVTPQTAKDTLSAIKHDAQDIVPIEEVTTPVGKPPLPKPVERSVTVYVHGYDDKGTTYNNIYGYDAYDPILDKFVKLTGFDTLQTYNPKNFTNIVTITPYYGTQAPDYYTPEDVKDIKDITSRYGGGIPRYAMIVAKYAKHVMTLTGAEHVNFIGASLGGLVSRWIIEKDVEHLASQHKILRWLSVEGVIRGNKVASNHNLVSLANSIQTQPIDVKHMDYDWIEQNLHNPRYEAASPYYSDILISEISSTKSAKPFGYLMPGTPNDGYQALEDTYFKSFTENALFHNQQPTHTYFHQTHLGIKKDAGAWADMATFFLPHKRIKITLSGATVDDIHERTNYFNKRAEIVFQSQVYSPLVAQKWDIDDAISERMYDSGALPIHRYKKDHEHQDFSQVIYDDFVLSEESRLHLTLAAYEIDNSILYNVYEGWGTKSNLGETSLDIDLKDTTYPVSARDWSGTIKVEVLPTFR